MNNNTHIELRLRDLGPLIRPGREWVANFDRESLVGELFQKLVVDPGLNLDPGSCTARLSVIPASAICK
jgi:hypothetical protein